MYVQLAQLSTKSAAYATFSKHEQWLNVLLQMHVLERREVRVLPRVVPLQHECPHLSTNRLDAPFNSAHILVRVHTNAA